MWVKECHLHHPPVITIPICGFVTIPKHGWFKLPGSQEISCARVRCCARPCMLLRMEKGNKKHGMIWNGYMSWLNRSFLKCGRPWLINFNRIFHYKPSILGYPHLSKPPNPSKSVPIHIHHIFMTWKVLASKISGHLVGFFEYSESFDHFKCSRYEDGPHPCKKCNRCFAWSGLGVSYGCVWRFWGKPAIICWFNSSTFHLILTLPFFHDIHVFIIFRYTLYKLVWQAYPHCIPVFFPTSLCGVLVFGCPLPPSPSVLPPPPPPASSSCRPPATCPHTTCSHTTCSHTTCPQTTCPHTTCPHTTCSHTTYSHITCTTQLAHTQLAHTQLAHTQLAHTQLVHTHTLVHTQLAHTQLLHRQLAHTTCTHTQLAHTQFVHTQLVHTQLAHTQLDPTQLTHTQLVPHNLLTHNLLTHNLPTQLAHTQLVHTHNLSTHNSLTHNFSTDNLLTQLVHTHNLLTHNLSTHNLSTHNWLTHNLIPHNLLTHNLRRGSLRGRRGAWRHPASLCVAGVALGDIDRHFAWQAWHLWHTHHLWHTIFHTTLSHTIFHTPSQTIFHTPLCHTPSFLHLLLCLSFLPRPRYNICCSLLEEVDLWGYPVL